MRTPNHTPVAGRVLLKTTRSDECWLWDGHLDKKGYGYLGIDGVMVRAHRASYAAFFGPIPDGLEIDHLCRVPACVNPLHLEPVTGEENNARRQMPAPTHCKRGHEYDEQNTYLRAAGGRWCRACGRIRSQAYKSRQRALGLSL